MRLAAPFLLKNGTLCAIAGETGFFAPIFNILLKNFNGKKRGLYAIILLQTVFIGQKEKSRQNRRGEGLFGREERYYYE